MLQALQSGLEQGHGRSASVYTGQAGCALALMRVAQVLQSNKQLHHESAGQGLEHTKVLQLAAASAQAAYDLEARQRSRVSFSKLSLKAFLLHLPDAQPDAIMVPMHQASPCLQGLLLAAALVQSSPELLTRLLLHALAALMQGLLGFACPWLKTKQLQLLQA